MYEAFRGKRFLITGARGLIGSNLVRRLLDINREHTLDLEVVAMGRNIESLKAKFDDYLSDKALSFMAGDVCDPELLKNQGEFNYIVHAAGNSHPKAFAEQPVETMYANILGMINFLEYAKGSSSVDKVLFLSTGEVYGETEPLSEKGWSETCAGKVDSSALRSCYPESKRASETLCVSYAAEYGVPAVSARLAYIYGPGNTEDNSRADVQFLRKAEAGEDIVMKSKGDQLRSYCYVEDAVTGLITILERGEPGEVYNVSNNKCRVTIREYAEALAKIFGVNIVFDLPDSVEKAGYSTMKYEVLDSSKLEALGYKPRFSLEEGLENLRAQCR